MPPVPHLGSCWRYRTAVRVQLHAASGRTTYTKPAPPLPSPPPRRSAPEVARNPANPVLLTCQPSPGGPWKTCEVWLCLLAPSGVCPGNVEPFNRTCEFTAGGAGPCNINMTGSVIQGGRFGPAVYSIATRVSVNADGVRTSESSKGGNYSLPFFP